MRHHRLTKRFGRNRAERNAMIENMVTSLMTHQQIKTTLQKAKVAKRLADRIITLGKKDTLASRRQVFGFLQDHQLTSKIFKEVAPRFKNRVGGYTRIMQLGLRKGDGAQLAILELTEKEIVVKDPKKGKKKGEKAPIKHDHGHEHDTKHLKEPETKEVEPKTHFHKTDEASKGKPKTGFFKNLGKFFRNKGGS
jgi:large subunit ribosomal protein L17